MTIEELLDAAQQFWGTISVSTLIPGLEVQIAATVASVLVALLVGHVGNF